MNAATAPTPRNMIVRDLSEVTQGLCLGDWIWKGLMDIDLSDIVVFDYELFAGEGLRKVYHVHQQLRKGLESKS